MTDATDPVALVTAHIRDIRDFPRPGIVFKDLTPLLSNPVAFKTALQLFEARLSNVAMDFIACPEARGFIWGAPLAQQLNAGLTLVRKPGKLPDVTWEHTYELEYGKDTLAIHKDAFSSVDNPRVLVVDDVLATGGTARATAALVEAAGGQVVGYAMVLELDALHGRQCLTDAPVTSLLHY